MTAELFPVAVDSRAELIAAASSRADVDCRLGLANLEVVAAGAPEFAVSGDASGKRLLVAVRGPLNGMLAHLRRSMTKNGVTS